MTRTAPRLPGLLLGIHHVRDDLGGPLGWDLAFLAFGVALIAVGWGLTRSGADQRVSRRPASSR